MGRKRTQKKPLTRQELGETGSMQFQQSQAINNQTYYAAYSQMLNIALSRFKWINLPKTCDPAFLEYSLLFDGCATIAHPKNKKGVFFTNRAVQDNRLNVYYRPTAWRAYGLNGWSFRVDNSNGVFIYSNKNRSSLLPIIEFFAHEIEDLYITKRQNRFHQKIPYILETPAGQQTAGINVIKQISGGELAMMVTPDFTNTIKADVLNTNVEYIGDKLNNDIQQVWSNFYQALGISTPSLKMERQTADEIQDYNQPSDLRALSELDCRREACDILNTRFAQYLDKPVSVVWNADNQSDNYNYAHNMRVQEETSNE